MRWSFHAVGYREEFGLDEYDSAAAMQIAVAKIPFTAGDTTDTADAIRYARDVILRHARPSVTRIIICITDGRSTLRSQTIAVRIFFLLLLFFYFFIYFIF